MYCLNSGRFTEVHGSVVKQNITQLQTQEWKNLVLENKCLDNGRMKTEFYLCSAAGTE